MSANVGRATAWRRLHPSPGDTAAEQEAPWGARFGVDCPHLLAHRVALEKCPHVPEPPTPTPFFYV